MCTFSENAQFSLEYSFKQVQSWRKHIQIDKQFPSTELDKYLLLEICKEAAEAVRMYSEWEYFPETEQDPRTAQLHTMIEEERKTFPQKTLSLRAI